MSHSGLQQVREGSLMPQAHYGLLKIRSQAEDSWDFGVTRTMLKSPCDAKLANKEWVWTCSVRG